MPADWPCIRCRPDTGHWPRLMTSLLFNSLLRLLQTMVIQLGPTMGRGMGCHCPPALDASRTVPNATRLQDSGRSLSECRGGVRHLACKLRSRHTVGDVEEHGINVPSRFISLAIIIRCRVVHDEW